MQKKYFKNGNRLSVLCKGKSYIFLPAVVISSVSFAFPESIIFGLDHYDYFLARFGSKNKTPGHICKVQKKFLFSLLSRIMYLVVCRSILPVHTGNPHSDLITTTAEGKGIIFSDIQKITLLHVLKYKPFCSKLLFSFSSFLVSHFLSYETLYETSIVITLYQIRYLHTFGHTVILSFIFLTASYRSSGPRNTFYVPDEPEL